MSMLLGGPTIGKDATASRSSGDVQVWFGGDRRKTYMARIRRVSTGSMELLLPLFIGPSQTVEMVYSGCRVHSRVIRCVELAGDSYLATVRLLRCAGAEMRVEPRMPVHIEATLQALGSAEKHPIVILDISQSGLGVRLPVTLAVGQQVAVDLGQGIGLFEVRYCRVTPEGKRAGFQLLEFLDREVPVHVAKTGAKDSNSTKLSGVLRLIRSKRNDIIGSESDQS
jgi:PilZ domain